jgi:hypothetical protein
MFECVQDTARDYFVKALARFAFEALHRKKKSDGH